VWIRLVDLEDLKAAPLTKFDINDDVSIVCGMIDKKAFAFDSVCPTREGLWKRVSWWEIELGALGMDTNLTSSPGE